MTKIKKIAAAAIAAASMSVIGATAFATVNWGYDFHLNFEAHEANVFTHSETKTDTFADPAAVTIHDGAIPRKYVNFSVWDSADELYGHRLTPYVSTDQNYDTKQMPYDTDSYTRILYMNAYSSYDTDILGLWAP